MSSEFAPDFFAEDSPTADRFARLRNFNPRDRQAEVQKKLDEKEVCERCGSNWFAEITFNQYRRGQYSSSPGGALETINVMPMPTLICLCGFPLLLGFGGTRGGPTPNKDLTSYDASVRAAQAHLLEARSQPDVTPQIESVVRNVLGSNLVTTEELDAVKAGLGQVSAKLQSMTADVTQEEVPEESVEVRRGPGRPKKEHQA